METTLEETVRAHAYQIWIREGKPDGKAFDHWLRAKEELDKGEDVASASDTLSMEELGDQPTVTLGK